MLAGCETLTEYVYVEPECMAPALVEPPGFSWEPLVERDVPVETMENIDNTVQLLMDEILVRQSMLEEICGP